MGLPSEKDVGTGVGLQKIGTNGFCLLGFEQIV